MTDKKHSRLNSALIIIAVLITQLSCATKQVSDLTKESIIPKPVSMSGTGGFFVLKEGADIYVQGESAELNMVAKDLAAILVPATGFDIEVKSTREAPKSGNIFLTLSGTDARLGEEGYELTVTKDLLKLTANGAEGIFRGIQTIRQILPVKIELASKQSGPWKIATGTITDYPAYSYRGAMLDVARHFFSVDDVKRFIDFLVCYKMNALHLHLSDDQGWRIEIKSWPLLATHGGSTQVGGGKGGFYTQEQYTDIVQYAKDHYIIVVPEIDMPGHINAALSSYPELNCNGKATELYTGTEVGFSTLCTNKEITYKFINDVIGELTALTPGQYIHIGGDESHVTKKEDYIPFVSKVQDIVLAHGKKVIGWDEITLSALKPNSVAQFWSSVDNANRAVSQGAKIIMSPGARAYIDMKYDSTTTLGLHWAGYVEVDKSYSWDPATLVPGIGKDNILGIEAALWTETISNMDDMEYMVFPRLPGLAEVGWTPSGERNWEEYKVRLGNHGIRFKAMDINFYPSKLVPWVNSQ
jgi:hexosaminidase